MFQDIFQNRKKIETFLELLIPNTEFPRHVETLMKTCTKNRMKVKIQKKDNNKHANDSKNKNKKEKY